MEQNKSGSQNSTANSSSNTSSLGQKFSAAIPGADAITEKFGELSEKMPSMGYVAPALASVALSAGISLFSKNKGLATFVGLWGPTILLLGVYNKLCAMEKSRSQDLH